MSTPTETHTAIIADIKKTFPQFKTVRAYEGQINSAAIKSEQFRTPACFVSLSAFTDSNGDGVERMHADCAFSCFIVTKKSGVNILDVVTRLSSHIHLNHWGQKGVSDPKFLRGRHITTQQAGKDGVSVWGIDWKQQLQWERTLWDDVPDFIPDTVFTDIFDDEPQVVPS